MTATPGIPDDWTDTVEPKRAEAFVEHLPAGLGYNLRHHAVDIAHRIGETCHCRPTRIPHAAPTDPESARGGCMADFDAPQAPQEVPAPEMPANRVSGLPRRIAPEDVRVGMVVERRKGECYVGGRVKSIDGSCIGLGASVVAWTFGGIFGDYGWSLWLIEDAPAPEDPEPAPVDPDAAAIEAIITAYRRSPECSTHSVFGEAMLDNLRAQGFDVTPRAEQ